MLKVNLVQNNDFLTLNKQFFTLWHIAFFNDKSSLISTVRLKL